MICNWHGPHVVDDACRRESPGDVTELPELGSDISIGDSLLA